MTISPLSDLAYKSIVELIQVTGIEPGHRLPGELELAARCGVSRPIVRQALARLRAEGWVVSRRGAGNFVGKPPAVQGTTFGPLQSIPDVRSFLEFRCVLEGESAAAAARCNDQHLLENISRRRKMLEAALARGENGIEEDIAFHQAIAVAGGNRFYVMTMSALAEQTRVAIKIIRDLSPQPMFRRAVDVHREHAAIDLAIRSGNADQARAAMVSHLQGGLERLFGIVVPVSHKPSPPDSLG